jgi:[CysO sulfur-carrier protein]-S-L-cysteine hydrolase
MNTVPDHRILILREIQDRMIRLAIGEMPNECCGMLGGELDPEGGTARITHFYPLINTLQSPTRFRADAKQLLLTHRRMRADGVELIAIYHSHPSSAPVPSRIDLDEHFHGENVSCVILGMLDDPPDIRAWRITPTGSIPVEWEVHA